MLSLSTTNPTTSACEQDTALRVIYYTWATSWVWGFKKSHPRRLHTHSCWLRSCKPAQLCFPCPCSQLQEGWRTPSCEPSFLNTPTPWQQREQPHSNGTLRQASAKRLSLNHPLHFRARMTWSPPPPHAFTCSLAGSSRPPAPEPTRRGRNEQWRGRKEGKEEGRREGRRR